MMCSRQEGFARLVLASPAMFGGKLNGKVLGIWSVRRQDGPSGVMEGSGSQVVCGGGGNVMPCSSTCLS